MREKKKAKGEGEDSPAIAFGKHAYTLFVVMIDWILFRADSVSHAGQYVLFLFGFIKGRNAGLWHYVVSGSMDVVNFRIFYCLFYTGNI